MKILREIPKVILVGNFFISAILSASLASAKPLPKNVEDLMVVVPGGTFDQGSPADELGYQDSNGPAHEVKLKTFYLSKYEVTVAEFRLFVQETGYVTDAERNVPVWGNPAKGCWSHQRPDEPSAAWVSGHSWRNPGFPQADTHPVVCVSWNDAKAYLAWLSGQTELKYRLPAESEFEYALRADSRTSHAWPDNSISCAYANHADKSLRSVFSGWKNETTSCNDNYAFSAPVGSYEINKFGIYDLTGNVSEWTADCWRETYKEAPIDGRAWESPSTEECGGRVLRGGDFTGSISQLRSAHRTWIPESFRTYHAGFRVALDH